MSQLALLDFELKDQTGVEPFGEFMTNYAKELKDYKEIDRWVDQDDPLHVIFLVQWVSREIYDKEMEKMFSNQEIAAMLEATFTRPAVTTWLTKAK